MNLKEHSTTDLRDIFSLVVLNTNCRRIYLSAILQQVMLHTVTGFYTVVAVSDHSGMVPPSRVLNGKSLLELQMVERKGRDKSLFVFRLFERKRHERVVRLLV